LASRALRGLWEAVTTIYSIDRDFIGDLNIGADTIRRSTPSMNVSNARARIFNALVKDTRERLAAIYASDAKPTRSVRKSPRHLPNASARTNPKRGVIRMCARTEAGSPVT